MRAGLWRGLSEKWQRAQIQARVSVGVPVPLPVPDRRVLEQTIFPFYAAQPGVRRVLFAGTAWYTAHYASFFPRQEFWTIEPVASRRRYGARHHIVDTLDALPRHVAPGSFDLAIVNGVIGYGLDDPADIETSFDALAETLPAGGRLLLGWDDVPHRCPVRPEGIAALRRFVPDGSTPFGGFRHACGDEHHKTYDFYRKA